jgi:hypothetical protein
VEHGDTLKDTPSTPQSVIVDPCGNGEIILNHILPEPASDTQIKGQLASLNNSIDGHVRDSQVYFWRAIKSDVDKLSESIRNSGMKTNPRVTARRLAALLLEPSSRAHAIRYLIAWVIFSNMDSTSPTRAALFPDHITAFLRSIPPVENDPYTKEGKTTFIHT